MYPFLCQSNKDSRNHSAKNTNLYGITFTEIVKLDDFYMDQRRIKGFVFPRDSVNIIRKFKSRPIIRGLVETKFALFAFGLLGISNLDFRLGG
jgi:hypothetical protein